MFNNEGNLKNMSQIKTVNNEGNLKYTIYYVSATTVTFFIFESCFPIGYITVDKLKRINFYSTNIEFSKRNS